MTSPGGTAAISMPSDPNFMCTGLVTVAPFFGSTKNTLIFDAFAAGFWALGEDAEPRHHHEHREHELFADFHNAISFSRCTF